MSQAIRLRLGYVDDAEDPVLSTERQALVDDILFKLDQVDDQLEQVMADANAVKLDTLEVNQMQHIGVLNGYGSKLLKRLAQLSGLEVIYDSYLGTRPRTGQTPFMVTNFW